MTVCQKSDHTINQVVFQLVDVVCALLINMGLEDSPKFCNRPDRSGLLGGQTSGEMKSGVAWPQILDGGTYTMGRCAVIPQTLVCKSGASCHGNSCSWYSAM